MARYYGQGCGPLNNCGVYKGAGWVCECDGAGNCSEWAVGDPDLWSEFEKLSVEEFAEKMNASTTKFALDREGHFLEVGIFLAAGCMVGDRLFAVSEYNTISLFSLEDDRQEILTWDFNHKELTVLFERGNEKLWATMKNPAIKK